MLRHFLHICDNYEEKGMRNILKLCRDIRNLCRDKDSSGMPKFYVVTKATTRPGDKHTLLCRDIDNYLGLHKNPHHQP